MTTTAPPPLPGGEAVALPVTASPTVSVVVLSWRLGAELLSCLAALAGQVGAPPFEVVLVQNGASPAARAAASQVTGAVVVDLPENAGFGGGCAAGAARARGTSLVFLNDDAVVDRGWLAALAARADAPDRPVAVGSLLLDSDGRVQEAGSRVLSSAGTLQHGRGATLDEARALGLLESRPVDYCSAAALWVERSAFDLVGGFDELFTPAYFEDVDLQFRLRLRLGRSVVVEPSAVAHHASGASTGSDPLYREFLGLRNGRAFSARWAATLADAPTADAPLDELCTVREPLLAPASTDRVADDGSADDDTRLADPHPAVAADYLRWLSGEVSRLRADLVVAAERVEGLDALRSDHADLQAEHHEALQTSHGMMLHIQHLESETILDHLKDAIRHRDRPH
jgi:GT2 family glycosyltransferase